MHPMHSDQIQIPAALDRLHDQVDAVAHVDLEHPLRVNGFGELVTCVGVVVWVDELAQPIEAVQLVVDVEDGSVGIVTQSKFLVLREEISLDSIVWMG
jgi:hypothetical protein